MSAGYKPEGITYPSGAMQQKLMSMFYDEVRIDPSTLAYVEAHSTGITVGYYAEMIISFVCEIYEICKVAGIRHARNIYDFRGKHHLNAKP